MLTQDFILDFKKSTEARWRNHEIDPGLYGFQIRKGTRWNPGLSEHQISQFERDLGFSFSPDIRLFLVHLNGTDKPTLNVYGNCGEPHREGVGVYSYPKDFAQVKERLSDVAEDWSDLGSLLAEVGLGKKTANLLPFYSHRYAVCGNDFPGTPVLSIHGSDAIVYGRDFREYLQKEFLSDD